MELLRIDGLTKQYGEKTALSDFSFTVNEGEIVALIGRNGAGKTTLLNIIAGITKPTQGKVYYKGADLQKQSEHLAEFGILITAVFLEYLSAYENLKNLMYASGAKVKKEIDASIDDVLDLVGLSAQKSKRVKSFSFGMKQRLGFAQTLLQPNRFMVLDEPFVGMDPLGKEMMKSVIRAKAHSEGVGILFSSHDLSDVEEICDRVIMISSGSKVYDGQFDNSKRYRILFDTSKYSQAIEALSKKYPDLEVLDNAVAFSEPAMLNGLLETLHQHRVEIQDIDTENKSLYSFFAAEV